MRQRRQNMILDLIKSNEVGTQEQLSELLKLSGFDVTQATVSRDIKELGLFKTLSPTGQYKYTAKDEPQPLRGDPFAKIFKETVQTVNSTGNLIIIKTLSGCGPAAGEALDSMGLPNIVGSIAGDNTVFLAINDPSNTSKLVDHFNSLLG